jgi:two-component system secretion system response regulator SalR
MGILVLTGFDSPVYRRTLREMGVQGYLDKSAGGNELIAAVQAVARGEGYGAVMGEDLDDEPPKLTIHEMAILNLAASGLRNVDIAERIRVAERTVEYHLRNLFFKLHVRSRTEMVLKARELGYLPTDALPMSSYKEP